MSEEATVIEARDWLHEFGDMADGKGSRCARIIRELLSLLPPIELCRRGAELHARQSLRKADAARSEPSQRLNAARDAGRRAVAQIPANERQD